MQDLTTISTAQQLIGFLKKSSKTKRIKFAASLTQLDLTSKYFCLAIYAYHQKSKLLDIKVRKLLAKNLRTTQHLYIWILSVCASDNDTFH
jgi:hypothetical protein